MIIQNYLEIPNKTFLKFFSVSNSICCCFSINFAYTLYAIWHAIINFGLFDTQKIKYSTSLFI